MRKWVLLSNTHKIVVAIVLLGCLCACTKKALVVGAGQAVLPDEIGQTFTCLATATGSLGGAVDGDDRFLTPVDATLVVAADVPSLVVAVKRIAGAASVSIASQWQSQSVPSHEIAVRFIHAGNYTLEFELADVSGKRAVCSWHGALSASTVTIPPESAPVIRSITPVPAVVSSGSPVTVTVVAEGNISEIRVGGVVLPQGANSLSLANTQSGRRVVMVTVTGPGGVASGETSYLVNPSPGHPTVRLASASTFTPVNTDTMIDVTSTNAISCITIRSNADGSNPTTFATNLNSGFNSGLLVQNTRFTVTCQGAAGTQPATDSLLIRVDPNPFHIMFVSSTLYTGAEIGGLSGADRICQQLGDNVNRAAYLNRTWKAILADSETDARDRIQLTGNVYNSQLAFDGARLLSAGGSFWDHTQWQSNSAYDEHGFSLTKYLLGETEHRAPWGQNTWTGFSSDGVRVSPSQPSQYCGDWTSNSGQGMTGTSGTGAGSGGWALSAPQYRSQGCNSYDTWTVDAITHNAYKRGRHIYCISQ